MSKLGSWLLDKGLKVLFFIGLLFYFFSSGKKQGKNEVKKDQLEQANEVHTKTAEAARTADRIPTATKRDRLREHQTRD